MSERGYHSLVRGLTTAPANNAHNVTAPASGATIVVWSSTDSGATDAARGKRYKRLILAINSSHDSGASGVIFEVSFDGGTNWRTLYTATYLTADGLTTYYISVANRDLRVRYTNSAATLTTWELELMGDVYERAA